MGEQFFFTLQAIEDFGLVHRGLHLYCDDVPMYFILPIPSNEGMYVQEVLDAED